MKKKPKTDPKQAKRLLISKEKVRDLVPAQLAGVAGGHCCKTYQAH